MMKLSTKLTMAFSLLAIIIVCLGALSLLQMQKINVASTEIAQNWLPSVINVQRIDTLTSDFRNAEVRHIYSENEKTMANYEKTFEELRNQITMHLKKAEELIVLPEARALFDDYLALRSEYANQHRKMLKLSQELKTDEATAVLDGDSRAAYLKLAATISKLVELNTTNADKASAEGDEVYAAVQQLVSGLLILSIAIAIGLALYIIRDTLKLLGKDPGELGGIARSVAAGNLDVVAEGKPVGVYRDILAMVDNLKKSIEAANLESERARGESERALTAMQQAESASQEAAAKTESMVLAANRLEEVASAVSSASTELSAQVEQSEKGTRTQASRIAETATAMEEMNSTVLEVAKSAASAAEVSVHTREKATEGARVVSEVVQSIIAVQEAAEHLRVEMLTLDDNAQAISQIMNVISDIADQTNLLALNAAIEAARAGEAGRGFAVVADEVRKLAEKTMSSTVDVGNAIRAIQQSASQNREKVTETVEIVQKATALSNQSGEALSEIVRMVDSTADQVRTIATASEQQSATSNEINQSIVEINNIADENSRAMSEASRAVEDLVKQNHVVGELITDMKQG